MAAKRVYIADYRDEKGKRHRTQHATRAEADAVEANGKAEAAKAVAARMAKVAKKAQGIAIEAAAGR